jgi:hypothetical protein
VLLSYQEAERHEKYVDYVLLQLEIVLLDIFLLLFVLLFHEVEDELETIFYDPVKYIRLLYSIMPSTTC